MIGQTISHYKILEKLGEGGMGIVYKAQDTTLDRFVAIKFLHQHLIRDEDSKHRFIQEAKTASALNHPNIGVIYEIDETSDGETFIVMAYYEGETLRDRLDRGPVAMEEALDTTIQVASGLAKAHEKGIVHRDIKPSNILITEDGRAEIIDFGLAKLAGQTKLTKEGSTLGTAAYMSPEQAKGGEMDGRSDIFSLGAVLYELIVGATPFKGDHEAAMLYEIVHEEPEPVTALRSGIPMELERIVVKALTKRPDERYQHADEMLADLKKLKKELEAPAKVQPSKLTDRELRKRRFRRIFIPTAVIIVVALAFLVLQPLLFEEVLVSAPKPIAVINFENKTGDSAYDNLREVIPDLLITSLEQSSYLRVTTMERMHDLLKQMGKEDVEIIDKDLGFELCRLDGIDAIVLGSFAKAGDVFVTDVKVLDVRTKELLKSASSKGEGVGSILKNQIDELSREISKGVGLSETKIEVTQVSIADVTTNSIDAYHYFLRGREEWSRFYWEDAIRFLEKAVEIDSTFASAYFYLATAHLNYGNWVESKMILKKAKAVSETATDKEKLYIDAFYSSNIEKDEDKFFDLLKQITKKYPKEKRAHFYLANDYYMGKKLYQKAIEELKKAIELDSNYGDAINSLAYVYSDIGDFENAIEWLKRYAAVSPGNANPFDSMGEIYIRMGRLDEAIAKYKEALEIRPDFGSEIRIAYIYALREEYTEVFKWTDQFLSMTQSVGFKMVGHSVKGFYHFWLGSFERSQDELQVVENLAEEIGFGRGKAAADLDRAWFHYETGSLDLSKKYFDSYYDYYAEKYPEELARYKLRNNFRLGMVDLKAGHIDLAQARLDTLKSLSHYIKQEDKELEERLNSLLLAEILLAEGSAEEALDVYEKRTLSKMPMVQFGHELIFYNVPIHRDFPARVYLEMGEIEKATVEYERLITFDPESTERQLVHPTFHYSLAKLYEEKNRQGKAIEQYKRFLEIWKDADEELPDLIDAKERLAQLRGATVQ